MRTEQMEWVDFDGQPTDGYEYIGTDILRYPIEETTDVQALLEELVRRCGKSAPVRLYRRRGEDIAG